MSTEAETAYAGARTRTTIGIEPTPYQLGRLTRLGHVIRPRYYPWCSRVEFTTNQATHLRAFDSALPIIPKEYHENNAGVPGRCTKVFTPLHLHHRRDHSGDHFLPAARNEPWPLTTWTQRSPDNCKRRKTEPRWDSSSGLEIRFPGIMYEPHCCADISAPQGDHSK